MNLQKLAEKVGLNLAVKMKWENNDFSENYLDNLICLDLLVLYNYCTQIHQSAELQKMIFSRLEKLDLLDVEWMDIYEANSGEIEVLACERIKEKTKTFNDWIELENKLKSRGGYFSASIQPKLKNLIELALKLSAETFIHWQTLHLRLDFDNIGKLDALGKMIEQAKTFEEWLSVYDKSSGENQKAAWRKLLELEKAEK